jgi:hypothetical protein
VVQNQLIIHQNNPYFNTLPEQIKGLMLRIRTTHFETNKQHMTGLSSTSNTHHPPTHHNVHTTKLTHIMQWQWRFQSIQFLVQCFTSLNSKTRIGQPSLYMNIRLVWKTRRAADEANKQDIFIVFY